MPKKEPISQRDGSTIGEPATLVPSPKATSRLRARITPASSDLSTIGFETPPELPSEALSACVELGDTIGKNKRFEITARLGKGGMGVVFAARDRQLDRSVAIKFILPASHIPWGELVKILKREARATARLRHDNIVAIFDIATWKRVPYLVMEHLEGDSLSEMLSNGPLTVQRATEIMIGVARGVAHAHSNGIIHRDLKPSNVFILKGGRAKILDFGLAAFTQLPGEPSVSKDNSNPSAGTPTSMAPEQWRGDSPDERADVWAMGIMLFQLLTGQRPFASTDARGLYDEICSEQSAPSVLSIQDNLPEQAEMIVARALQKKREARFQTASQLLEALVSLHRLLIRSPDTKREARRTMQRRQLTFLSCRLIPPATLTDDPEDESEFLSKFTSLCASSVAPLNGRLVSVLGSRAVACFGHPIAREGDAERAVRAALEIIKAAKSMIAQQGGAAPRVRVGIHTGLEIIEDVEGEPEALHVQGATPQIAASLESQAPDNAVVIGSSTYQLAHTVFDFEPIGSLSLDGGSQPMVAYKVLREKEDVDSRFDAAFASSQTPLIGRETDVEHLLELWHRARNSAGHFVLLTGEAGIGKSRLVRAFKDRVGSNAATRMSCQCWPQFKSSAFHAVIELVLRSTGILREDSAQQKIHKLELSLSSLQMNPAENIPVLASLLSISLPGSSDLPFDPRERKKRTIDTLTAMLLAMAAQKPVLFVAEDLHWADHSSLELLGALLERMESARILVLATARPEFRTVWPSRNYFHQLPITHLPPQLAAEMIERAAGEGKLPADVIESLVQRTEGVPLFIEEMTRTLVDSLKDRGGAAPVTDSAFARAIPTTLNELFLARLDRLTPASKELAQIAAVVGRSFPHTLIQHISGMEEAALQDALFSLTEAEVLLSHGRPGEAKYQFKHFLIQDAAYHSLPKKKRKLHHLKAADVLKELFPETAEVQPELLAHHYTEAGEVEQALGYWEKAGRRAAERFANVEAISHFTRALQLLAKTAEGSARDRKELSLQLAVGAPLMAVKGYAAPEVEKAYARARELCRSAGEDIQLFPAIQGLWQFFMVGGELPIARELAEQLLGAAQNSGDSTLHLIAYRSLATTVFLQGEIVRCRELTDLGLAMYDPQQHGSLGLRFGHDPGVAHGVYAAWALWLLGQPEQALKKAIAAVALAEQLSHPVSIAFAKCYLAVVQNSCGRYEAAVADATASKAVSQTHQLALWLSVGTMMEGWARFGLGEWEPGIALLQQGVAAWRRTGARAGMTFFLVIMADAYRKAGLPAKGMAVLEEAEALVSRNSEHYYEAELYRVKGELRLALAPQDFAAGKADIEHALVIARNQNAKSLELRAAMSLCSLTHQSSPCEESRQRLHAIYQSFSEGLATADLLMARTALESISGPWPNTSSD